MTVLIAGVYFLVAVALHAIWCRFPPQMSAVFKYVGVGGLTGLALVGHLVSVYGLSVDALAGVLAFTLASELYVFLFTMIISSVSAIWLRRLRRGNLNQAQIAELYSPAWMVDIRLGRLVDNGLMTRAGDRYALTPKGRRMIETFGRLRAFFGHARRV